MQIQSLSVTGALPPTDNNLARQGSAVSVLVPIASTTAVADVGGMLKNAVTGSGKTDKQQATGQQATAMQRASASSEQVDDAVRQVNDTLQMVSQKLEFSIDKDTEAFVVKVVDKETKEVIRQIPSEEMLELAKALDKLQGLLIRDQA